MVGSVKGPGWSDRSVVVAVMVVAGTPVGWEPFSRSSSSSSFYFSSAKYPLPWTGGGLPPPFLPETLAGTEARTATPEKIR